tara:strand:+ start:124 stop:1515 length:1392 start_codon:yes stop_codon:yes gene_type:complete
MNQLLPIFIKVEKADCLVIGGGMIALQKIEQLLDCKAKIHVVAPEIDSKIEKLSVNINKKSYSIDDLSKVRLVIAATNDVKVNKTIYKDCMQKGIPVNIVDQPELCTFYMGSVYKDGDLKIAISTNGKCPSFSVYIKNFIKNISKDMWGRALEELAVKREEIVNTLNTYVDKKNALKKIINKKFVDANLAENTKGKIFLIGAGPGDPELITAKGLKIVKKADVILYDALIHPHLVFAINPIAKKIFVGKRDSKHAVSQNTINQIMIDKANEGKIVIRLKGGDPLMFGRGGEEMDALVKAKIKFEIVPGVTSGIAAAAAFGIPLTHRIEAENTIFLTGHQCNKTDKQDWKIFANTKSTLVIYMGVRLIDEIVENLLENGKSKNTPVAIIQNATLSNQNIITSNLENICNQIIEPKKLTPAIIIIGEVVKNYKKIENILDSIPSDIVNLGDSINFDIWKNPKIIA